MDGYGSISNPGEYVLSRHRAGASKRGSFGQGLTLVHFPAQLEPCLTQILPYTPPETS